MANFLLGLDTVSPLLIVVLAGSRVLVVRIWWGVHSCVVCICVRVSSPMLLLLWHLLLLYDISSWDGITRVCQGAARVCTSLGKI